MIDNCLYSSIYLKHLFLSILIYTTFQRFLNLLIFFFFQAEDGIRDIGVTGVQTCALPISESLQFIRSLITLAHGFGLKTVAEGVETADDVAVLAREGVHMLQGWHYGRPAIRSEERRVGKECRSRWSPYH